MHHKVFLLSPSLLSFLQIITASSAITSLLFNTDYNFYLRLSFSSLPPSQCVIFTLISLLRFFLLLFYFLLLHLNLSQIITCTITFFPSFLNRSHFFLLSLPLFPAIPFLYITTLEFSTDRLLCYAFFLWLHSLLGIILTLFTESN